MNQENENWIVITLKELPTKGLYFAFTKWKKATVEFDPGNAIDKKLFKKLFSHYKMQMPEPPII
jgi:hypothetical protein